MAEVQISVVGAKRTPVSLGISREESIVAQQWFSLFIFSAQ
jgi:hypothetical protein